MIKKKAELTQAQKDRVTRLAEWLVANAAVVNETPKCQIVFDCAGNSIHYKFQKAGELVN